MKNRLTVQEAAKLMNAPEQFVRLAMREGILPIGYVLKQSERYTYCILKDKFEQETGIKVEQA